VNEIAEQFKRRAQHCRALADDATGGPRDDLLRVAADLEQEADEMDAEEAAAIKTDAASREGAPPGGSRAKPRR
jgi:hypothetical protein